MVRIEEIGPRFHGNRRKEEGNDERLFNSYFFAATLAYCGTSHADTFGSGDNVFEIPFVTIGEPGNAADTVTPHPFSAPLPSGVVDYVYGIGKYEIPEEAIHKANAQSEADGNPLGLTLDTERGPQKPATGINWFEAAQFANWLNEEKGHTPAYKFDGAGVFQLWVPSDPGYNPANPFRNTQAHYFLPSADEWHKAAYYDPVAKQYWDYPTGSDTPPIPVASGTDLGTAVFNQNGPADVMLAGGENPFGTIGMAGNIIEWEETNFSLTNSNVPERRGARAGDWNSFLPGNFASFFRNSALPGVNSTVAGLRIARVPEPGALLITLSLLASTSLAFRR